jgi:peptidoglycan L-alanyl-D-glutamate endopeptidase CwlK
MVGMRQHSRQVAGHGEHMPQFSTTSKQKLSECHPELQRLFEEVVKRYDCTIICGHRSMAEQTRLYEIGASKVRSGKHNSTPSMAVDVAPWFSEKPHIRWEDSASWYHFVGYVRGVADMLGIKIRVGADWDGDNDVRDQKFNDLPHIELV